MHRLLPRDVGDVRRNKSSLAVRYVEVSIGTVNIGMVAMTEMGIKNITETYFVFGNRLLSRARVRASCMCDRLDL
jgi:hypothetical protein